MGRRKILMDYIKDDRKRMSTFDKRRIGLFKKARELNKLCGVKIIVKIINNKSLYQFSDFCKEDISNTMANGDLKVEEDFNTDSFQEYLIKKAQSHKILVESSSNEYQSVGHDPVCIESEDESDQSFLKILNDKNVLVPFNKIKDSNNDHGNDSTDRMYYLPASQTHSRNSNEIYTTYQRLETMTESTKSCNNNTIDNSSNNDGQFSYTASLNSFDSSSSSVLENRNPYTNKDRNSISESEYSSLNSALFENIITTIQNDPELFGNSVWETHKRTHPVPTSHLDLYQMSENDARIDLDTPTLDALMNSQPCSLLIGLDVDSTSESDSPTSTEVPKIISAIPNFEDSSS